MTIFTSRIPVKPETLNKLRTLRNKQRLDTYDTLINLMIKKFKGVGSP